MTNAIIGRLPPIHQLADWPMANAVMTTAIAAGLKTCFFPIVRTYFDAIAKTITQIRKLQTTVGRRAWRDDERENERGDIRGLGIRLGLKKVCKDAVHEPREHESKILS